MPCSNAGQETVLGWSWSWSSAPCRKQPSPHPRAGWTNYSPTWSKLKKVLCSSVWFYFVGINRTAFLFMPYLSNECGSSWCLGKCCFSMRDSKAQEDQPIPLIFKTSCFLKLRFLGKLIASDILIAFLTTDLLSEERICFGLDWGVQEGHQNC